jgi:RNase H-fold protein (predicted Holliday junction resolvase)
MKKTLKKILQNLETETQHERTASGSEKIAPILAVDYGEKFTGIAWSPDGIVSLALDVFLTRNIIQTIGKFIVEKNIKQVVIGLPLSDSGEENENCKTIRSLEKQIKTPVTFVNERASTQMTHGYSRRKDTPRKDDLAAAQILEFWLQQRDFPIAP